jgi:very-short-patch-repair endonuclease
MTQGLKGFQKGHHLRLGKEPWNKGKVGIYKFPNRKLPLPCSIGTRKKLQISLKGNQNTLGKHWKIKNTSKMSEAKKGKRYALGKHWKVYDTSNMKGHYAENQGFQKGHKLFVSRIFKNTGIELKVETELHRRNIKYQKQVPLCNIAIVDFYLPEYRIIIQCDGDYWHTRPGAKERDNKQDNVLVFNGFNVYRFWEHEINESVEKCINNVFSIYEAFRRSNS